MTKTKTETKSSERTRFAREMAESLGDVHALGIMDDATYKRTMRDLRREGVEDVIVPLNGDEIRSLREHERVSQAVLAKYLNLTVDHLSKLERGAVRPTGALLAMLNVIRRKGLEAII